MTEKPRPDQFTIDASAIVHGPGGINVLKELIWHNTLESIWTQLEGFADEFERRAATPEQAALAEQFAAFVSNFTRERLSMAALGELGAELEEFDMDRIDVALAGELIELGVTAGQAWETWMDDQPVYVLEQVKDGCWVVWNTRDMEPEDIFSNEAMARQCAQKLNSDLHRRDQQRSQTKEASPSGAAELAAALFGGAAAPKESPEMQKEPPTHEHGRRRLCGAVAYVGHGHVRRGNCRIA
jgi:hypothetical protein